MLRAALLLLVVPLLCCACVRAQHISTPVVIIHGISAGNSSLSHVKSLLESYGMRGHAHRKTQAQRGREG